MDAVLSWKGEAGIIYHDKFCCYNMDKRENEQLRYELEAYSSQGVQLYLNGRESTVKRIAKAQRLAEEGEYMRDYIQD